MSLIDKIKEMFVKEHSEKTEAPEAAVEVKKHERYKLADGKEVEISAWEVGGTIEFVLEDGSLDGADAGEYLMEDGKIVVVAEKGIIAEIKEAAEMPEEEMPADMVVEEDKMTEIKNSIVYLAERIKSIEDENKKLKNEYSKLEAENKALKNAPVPAEKKRVEFKKLAEKMPEKKGKYADFVANLHKK